MDAHLPWSEYDIAGLAVYMYIASQQRKKRWSFEFGTVSSTTMLLEFMLHV